MEGTRIGHRGVHGALFSVSAASRMLLLFSRRKAVPWERHGALVCLLVGWVAPRSAPVFAAFKKPGAPGRLMPPKHRGWFVGIDSKAERACGSYVRSTCQGQKTPGQGGGVERQRRGRPASTRASAARLVPAIPPEAPAERRWSSSIVASTDTRWTIRRRPARSENSQPRRSV